MSSVFLLGCGNLSGNLGKLEEAVETLACWLMFTQHFSFFQTFSFVSI